MKKLLLLLFLPFLGLAQMSGPTENDVADGEGAAGLTYLGIKSNPNLPIGDVQVNDTIVIGIKLTNWLATTNDITYAHIDLQYNVNAYSFLGATYNATEGNPQNSTFEATGNKWNISSAVQAYDLWGQWQNGSASTNSDWNLLHLQTQVTSGDLADLNEYVTLEFKVNDAGANHDYTDNMFLPNGKLVDNPNNKIYNPVYAYPNQDLSLTPNADIDVTVSVKLEVGENVDITKFNLVPLKKNQTTDNDGDGVPDDFYYTIKEGSPFWINVPSNGVVDITEYLEDSTGEYAVVWEYGEPGNPNGTNDFKTLYENILTVSDVQLALKHLATHGAGAINAGVSLLNSDVAGSNNGGDGQLTDQDTYTLLAHVMGVDELYVDWNNDGTIDDNDANDQGNYFFRTLDGNVYTTTSAASYVQNGIAHNGSFHTVDIDFTNVTTSQQFVKKGTWKGDVNLSHSPAVDESIANDAVSIANAPNLMGMKVQSFGEAKQVVATVDGTIVISESGDKVIAKITIPEGDLTATQIRLTFDDTRLTFDTVKTASGNTATNFAKLNENRINFGSINTLGNKLTEVVYEVTFTKKGAIDGTTGLIILTNTDAADSEANRVELKIQ